jgi:beta-lactamase superfamily II metal-dependent hydrolase
MIELIMLPGEDGDCLLMSYGDQTYTRRMLIDGGRAATYASLKPTLTDSASKTIDVLVITHVDQDHILGVLKLFDDPKPPVKFADIWFNGYGHLTDNHFESFGPVDGEFLTAIMAARDLPWNKAFGGRAIEVGRPYLPFDDKVQLQILAPDRKSLERLIPTWTEECRKNGLIPGTAAEKLKADDGFERFGAMNVAQVKQLAATPFERDTSATNMTSIAFLFEYDNTRILFTGDGDVPQLIASLKPLADSESGRVRIDAMKVPHHGSHRNVSRELLEIIDCRRYLISTNGARHHHPDDIAMARILVFGGSSKELVFNYESRASLWRDQTLQAEFDYTVKGPDGADGFVLSTFK